MKYIVRFLLIIMCAFNCNSSKFEQLMNQDLEDVDYKYVERDENKFFCGEHIFAYITDSDYVYCIYDDGDCVEGWYLPEIDNATALFGEANFLFILCNDHIRLYYAPEKKYLNMSECTREGKIELFADFIDKNNKGIEDIYFQGTECIALKIDGKWVSMAGSGLDKFDISFFRQIEGNGYSPELFLRKDGKVECWIQGVSGLTERTAEEIRKWDRIKEIALGLVPYGLLENGDVITVSDDLAEWHDIQRITASYNIMAGLGKDGAVKVRSLHNEEVFRAEEWKDICYIKATPLYLLGIDAEGGFHFTQSSSIDEIQYFTNKTDCPKPLILKEI